jgi:hypothetical protein
LPKKKKLEIPSIPILPILGLIILGGVIYYLHVIIGDDLEEQLARLNKTLTAKKQDYRNKVADKKQELEKKRSQIDYVTQQMALVKRLTGDNIPLTWSQTFSDLTKVVPKDHVWLKTLSYDASQKIIFQGVSKPKEEDGKVFMYSYVGEFIKQLEESPNFSQIYLSTANVSQMHGKDVVDFHITCKLNKGGGVE